MGGIQLGLYDHSEDRWTTERVKLHDGFMFIMFVPDFTGIMNIGGVSSRSKFPLKDGI